MDCEETIRQVYFFLDGELTAYRRWQVSRHLNRCPPCQHGYDFELEVRQLVAKRCGGDEVPPELKQRICDAIGLFEARADPSGPQDPPGALPRMQPPESPEATP